MRRRVVPALIAAAREDFDGKVNKIELERQEGGGLEYEVEQLSETTKHVGEYDADSLARLSEKTDSLGDDAAEDLKETFDPGDLIDLDEAAKTARDEVDGVISQWKIEGKDSGKVVYEFDIRPQGASDGQEVHVDAEDGAIVKDS